MKSTEAAGCNGTRKHAAAKLLSMCLGRLGAGEWESLDCIALCCAVFCTPDDVVTTVVDTFQKEMSGN